MSEIQGVENVKIGICESRSSKTVKARKLKFGERIALTTTGGGEEGKNGKGFPLIKDPMGFRAGTLEFCLFLNYQLFLSGQSDSYLLTYS